MTVRTKQLASAVATTTLTTIYTCPSGKTAILRSFNVYNPSGGATTTFFARLQTSGNNRGLFIQPGLGANQGGLVETWIVMMPGDVLQINATPSSAVQVLVSGVELDGVAP